MSISNVDLTEDEVSRLLNETRCSRPADAVSIAVRAFLNRDSKRATARDWWRPVEQSLEEFSDDFMAERNLPSEQVREPVFP